MTGFFIVKCNINLCLKARESDKKKERGRNFFQEAVSIKQLCGEGLYLLMQCITESLENVSLL